MISKRERQKQKANKSKSMDDFKKRKAKAESKQKQEAGILLLFHLTSVLSMVHFIIISSLFYSWYILLLFHLTYVRLCSFGMRLWMLRMEGRRASDRIQSLGKPCYRYGSGFGRWKTLLHFIIISSLLYSS
jgi:hypothetical protein